MLSQGQFEHEWGVWLCFMAAANDHTYDNYQLLYSIRTPAELAYLWKQQLLNPLDQFLLKQDQTQSSYEVDGEWRRVNSVEYFKKGIEPKWEDPKNAEGGRFVFQVPRTQTNQDEIYSSLNFQLMGQDFTQAPHINGFRFISAKNQLIHYRVEIWVDFNDSFLEELNQFSVVLTELFNRLELDSKMVRFINNKVDAPVKKLQ